jgi:hypothetical protein
MHLRRNADRERGATFRLLVWYTYNTYYHLLLLTLSLCIIIISTYFYVDRGERREERGERREVRGEEREEREEREC